MHFIQKSYDALCEEQLKFFTSIIFLHHSFQINYIHKCYMKTNGLFSGELFLWKVHIFLVCLCKKTSVVLDTPNMFPVTCKHNILDSKSVGSTDKICSTKVEELHYQR